MKAEEGGCCCCCIIFWKEGFGEGAGFSPGGGGLNFDRGGGEVTLAEKTGLLNGKSSRRKSVAF